MRKIIIKKIIMILVILIVSIIGIIGCDENCFAYDLLNGELDPWTKEQKTMQITLTILAILDYGTTNYALQFPNKYYETEAGIYGHPTTQEMLEYGLKLYIGHLLVSFLLPSDWRDYWILGANIYQFDCVANNFYLGCKLKF